MGLHEALLPGRLRYADIHFWFDIAAQRTRCGLTSYAARLLGDLFRLEWRIHPGEELVEAQPIGEVESAKAASELYAPLACTLKALNLEAIASPERIGNDPYGTWLLEFSAAPRESFSALEYRRYLEDGWEETQRLLKGQL
jgi:glycine cleavage system H protein